MAKPGRKSGAELSVAVDNTRAEKLEIPPELTSEQGKEWEAVVSAMPADWFTREHEEMLANYCRHTVRHRVVSKELESFQPEDLKGDGVKRFNDLSKIAERESRAMLGFARSLRMTHQSQYDAGKAARKNNNKQMGPRPWE